MITYETRHWAAVIFRVRGSVLPRIVGRTVLFGAVGLLVAIVQSATSASLAISGTAHAMVGVALGLLLVFRTNASYDRYWEGCRLLGAMKNNCRDLARQGASLFAPTATEARHDVRRLTIAFYATVCRYLRSQKTRPELGGLLTEDELAQLKASSGPPLLVARWLSDCFAREANAGRLSEQRLLSLDGTVSDLIDHWGDAERIVSTPVPFAYAHHIKSFLTIFCATTPFALVGLMGWLTPAATAIVSWGLLGIEEIGVEIEDPFGYDANDLPLDTIGETISSDVLQMLGPASNVG